MSEENFFVNKFLYFQEKNQDDYFYNSLIYIFEHNKNGALGIVMNKVIPISENIIFKSIERLSEFWKFCEYICRGVFFFDRPYIWFT